MYIQIHMFSGNKELSEFLNFLEKERLNSIKNIMRRKT